MKNYLELMRRILDEGDARQSRNAVTRALFAQQLRWDLSKGFPLVTTKKMAWKSIVGELLWFLSGSTSDADLRKLCGKAEGEPTIWTANAQDPKWIARGLKQHPDDLGLIYGSQWRRWRSSNVANLEFSSGSHRLKIEGSKQQLVPAQGAGINFEFTCLDQIAALIGRLKADPFSRYHVVTAWNPGDLPAMALPPCHMLFQCFARHGKQPGDKLRLDLHMVQRSCDYFLGVPFNIASYALLTHILAAVTGMDPGELVITFNDVHVYDHLVTVGTDKGPEGGVETVAFETKKPLHIEACEEQLKREPFPLPTVWLPEAAKLERFILGDVTHEERMQMLSVDNFTLDDYQSHPAIKAEMIV